MDNSADDSQPLPSWLPTALYRPPQRWAFPNPPNQAPPAIPPQRPPVFYSGPDPAAAPPTSGGLGGLANGIANGINNHALTLMSLGAGIAQGGVGRGLELASAAAQAERNLQAQQVNHAHVFNALTGAGVPPDEALAAVLNPSLMRALAVRYLGPRAPSNARSGSAPAGAAAPAAPAPGAASYPPTSSQNNTPNMPPALASAPVTLPSASTLPSRIPNGSAFSPSRRMWRDADGNLFDPQGKAVR